MVKYVRDWVEIISYHTLFTIVIGALVVRRPLPRRRARSSILFRRGLRVFCGAGGLVGSRRNVGALLVAVSLAPLS